MMGVVERYGKEFFLFCCGLWLSNNGGPLLNVGLTYLHIHGLSSIIYFLKIMFLSLIVIRIRLYVS